MQRNMRVAKCKMQNMGGAFGTKSGTKVEKSDWPEAALGEGRESIQKAVLSLVKWSQAPMHNPPECGGF